MKLNSVIFHTNRLSEVREFYEEKLGLSVGTYVRENQTVQDCSDSYVNYHLDDSLLCFEEEAGRLDLGTIILSVPDYLNYRAGLEKMGIEFLKKNESFSKIKDPEGRSVIIEPEIN